MSGRKEESAIENNHENKARPPLDSRRPAEDRGGTSLYDDTFSESSRKSPWVTVAWVLVFLVVIAGVLAAIFSDSSKERLAELAVATQEERENSELARRIRELRKQAAADQSLPSAEEKPVEPPESEPGAGVPPPPEAVSSAPPATSPLQRRSEERTDTEPARPGPPAPPVRAEVQAEPEPGEPSPSGATSETDLPAAAEAVEQAEASAPAARDAAELEAYEALLEQSKTAHRLVEGRLETLEFKDWRVVQKTDREIWIDLIARWTTGEDSEIHLIWAVSRERGTVRPLSDAARTLDSGE